MLDLTISPNNHAYQFRVDILNPDTSGNYAIQLCKMLTEEEFQDWICSYEIAPVSNKKHYQCILWHKKLLSQKERNRLKAKYFRRNRDTNNSISFTCAKKITNLSSYVMKDCSQNEIITTLSLEKREKIPKWLTKNAIKSKWLKEVEDEILLICSLDVYGHYPTIYETVRKIIKFYIENDHPPPSRMTILKYLLKYHPNYSISNYIDDTYIFSS